MDSYAITLTTAPTIATIIQQEWCRWYRCLCSENYRFETLRTQIRFVPYNISVSIRSTSGTSPITPETSFSTTTTNTAIPLNENFNLDKVELSHHLSMKQMNYLVQNLFMRLV